jgi:glycosyltransferase involved in cell wall biosynthesis
MTDKLLLGQLRKSLASQDWLRAQVIALEIELRDYPSILKTEARQVLNILGRQSPGSPNIYSDRLYDLAKANSNAIQGDCVPRWLPWRIMKDAAESPYCNLGAEEIMDAYLKSYYSEGLHALHCTHNVSLETVEAVISDVFDYEYYCKSHSDLSRLSREEALRHYAAFGGTEVDRKPNRLVCNKEILVLYPWVEELKVNILYLVVRWPEQFPKAWELVRKRRALSECNIAVPWQRPLALNAPKSENQASSDYLRILSVVNEVSDRNRLIEPHEQSLKIHIVIPDFTAGGGGHMTIFRMVLHLENAGHECTIWVKDYEHSRHHEGPRSTVLKHYQPIKASILPLSAHFAFVTGDALIATSWDTVEIVRSQKSFHDYFYLVQDYEPYFYPRGSQSLKAEHTYSSGLKTICASSWLDSMMRLKYKCESVSFELSYNPDVYNCKLTSSLNHAKDNPVPFSKKSLHEDIPVVRVAFYARARTDRRAVELALEGLGVLKQDKFILCVELFGEKQGLVSLPRNVAGYDNGILSPENLAVLYHSCDIGLTFSATNHALVPQEMMACGLPVIEIDNESTRAIYPQDVVCLAEPTSHGIARAIERLALDVAERDRIAQAGYKWVQKTSWESSFKDVERFISLHTRKSANRSASYCSISERYLAQPYEVLASSEDCNYRVSIVIPTFQAGSLLNELLQVIHTQVGVSPFEIVIIDSDSMDGSIECIMPTQNMSIYRIDRANFQHGRTRNLGIALSKGPLVAFLTQDAKPLNDHWLANLIQPLVDNVEVCAVFGSHRAHPFHPKHLDESMISHFKGFETSRIHRKSDDLSSYYSKNPRRRQFMHYYSDNNSCLRKTTWSSYPYPDVSYGEDQLWADWIVQQGHAKAYAANAAVYHSHDYTTTQEYERAKTEAFFFKKYFGYNLGQNRFQIEVGIQQEAQKIIIKQGSGCATSLINRLDLLRAKREGYTDGCAEYEEWISSQCYQ